MLSGLQILSDEDTFYPNQARVQTSFTVLLLSLSVFARDWGSVKLQNLAFMGPCSVIYFYSKTN